MFTTLSTVPALQQQPTNAAFQGFCAYPVFFPVVPDNLQLAKLVASGVAKHPQSLKRPLELSQVETNQSSNEDDLTTRRKKRRVQVAEASRRSRAKRKEEFNAIKSQNEKLVCEAARLRARLEALESAKRGDENKRPGQRLSVAPMPRLNLSTEGIVDKSLKQEIEEEKSLAVGSSLVGEEDKEYYQIASFLRSQARSFLDHLKHDYKTWFTGISGVTSSERDEEALRLLDVEIVEL